MTDPEIREEAKRRLEGMSEEEKKKLSCLTEKEIAFMDDVAENGTFRMTSEENREYGRLLIRWAAKSQAGGMIESGFLSHNEEHFGITREDFANGAKNPYGKVIRRFLLISVILAAAAGAMGVIASNNGSEVLKYTAIGTATGSGLLAVRFADLVTAWFRYRKMQKKYMSGEMDEELIRSAMSKQVLDQYQELQHKNWYRHSNGVWKLEDANLESEGKEFAGELARMKETGGSVVFTFREDKWTLEMDFLGRHLTEEGNLSLAGGYIRFTDSLSLDATLEDDILTLRNKKDTVTLRRIGDCGSAPENPDDEPDAR